MREPMQPVLVLWDVDNTLIENGGVTKENYRRVFEILTQRLPERMVETDGRTDLEIVRDMLASNQVPAVDRYMPRAADVLEAVMAQNVSQLRERGHDLPGARSALSALQQTPGVVQSLLTGNIRPNALVKLTAFGLDSYVDFEVGGYGSDDKVRSNLVAVARKRAQAKYGTEFAEDTTVLVGDTTRDVKAGRDGGAYVIAVATGIDSEQRLRSAGADTVFADLRDTGAVVNVIKNLQAGRRQNAGPGC